MLALLALTLAPLETAIETPEAGWVVFDQPAVAGTGRMSCGRDGTTSLSDSEDYWNVHDDVPDAANFSRFTVFLEFEQGEVRQVRTYTPDCTVTDGNRAQHVEIDPAAAVILLDDLISQTEDRMIEQRLTATLAHVDHAHATQALAGRAAGLSNDEGAQDALFWLAQRRGEAGRAVVVSHLDERWPLRHRNHAVMSLALSKNADALETVRRVAREGESAGLRANAVVALGIVDAPGALADLHSIFLVDGDDNVREQAIFALAQLDHPEAARVLANIVRDPRNGEHRRTALFWLAHMPAHSSQREIDALVNELF